MNIYYRDVDPPNWAEYSHSPYRFSPNVEADVGPGQQWNLDVMLADPDHWAMVTASIAGESPQTPNIHCVLAVDGVVVKTHQGPKEALCSLRSPKSAVAAPFSNRRGTLLRRRRTDWSGPSLMNRTSFFFCSTR